MKTMKAVVFKGKDRIAVEEVPKPRPRAGEAVIRVTTTTICGTDVHITQEGIPDAIPVEMCYLGWQQSLAQLAKLVEPEIPD